MPLVWVCGNCGTDIEFRGFPLPADPRVWTHRNTRMFTCAQIRNAHTSWPMAEPKKSEAFDSAINEWMEERG